MDVRGKTPSLGWGTCKCKCPGAGLCLWSSRRSKSPLKPELREEEASSRQWGLGAGWGGGGGSVGQTVRECVD